MKILNREKIDECTGLGRIIEVETDNKTVVSYKIIQTPKKLYMKNLKFFLGKGIPDFMFPKIVVYYSLANPHRMTRYYGYKALGPASVKLSQVSLLFEDYMDVLYDRTEPLGVDTGTDSSFLFERMDHYNLFSDSPNMTPEK